MPTSDIARMIMMNSATNLNYDPLVQGAGLVNGDRAAELAAETGGLMVSPPFWSAGTFGGTEYEAFTNIVHRGDVIKKSFEVTNLGISLDSWPSFFTGRSLQPVIGGSSPHGPWNLGAATADSLAMVDIIGAAALAGLAVQGSRFDTEVLTGGLAYNEGYQTRDIISAGGPAVNLVNLKYNGPIAGAWFDMASLDVLTLTGHRYSDPTGRIAFISIVYDSGRYVLLASGRTAYGTRAAGAILKNYAAHADLLAGSAVVFIPADVNGNGVWEEGEPITIIEQVQGRSVSVSDVVLTKIGETTFSFLVDSSQESGYSFTRPDYIREITSLIPPDTNLMKVTAYFPFDAMDPDHDNTNTNNNGIRLLVYDWKDLNGNGILWNDLNSNGAVNSGEIEDYEYNRYTYSYPSGTTLEARVHDPLARYHNGIFVGLQHRYRSSLVTTLVVNVKVEFYTRTDWALLTEIPPQLYVPNKGTLSFEVQLAIPLGTPYGLYEGEIVVSDGSHETIIPVVMNVAPKTATFEFGGTPPADGLYDNGRILGGFDWRWRFESGDWRFFFVDVPVSEISAGTTLLADVSWSSTKTDVDLYAFGPTPDSFSAFWPSRYGPYTLDLVGGAGNFAYYLGDGRYAFHTATGGASEVISATATAGLNMYVLHNVRYDDAFAEPITGRVGTFTVTPSPLSIAAPAGSSGSVPVTILSTLGLTGLSATAFGAARPQHLASQTIFQDNPSDPSTSSWIREFNLAHTGLFEIFLHVGSNDLDLYILYDTNNNGVPDWDTEIMASSTAPAGIDELIQMTLPQDGRYWVAVHGWAVTPSPSFFDIDITIIDGFNLSTSGLPTGPITASTPVSFNLNYNFAGLTPGNYVGILFTGPAEAPTAVAVTVQITIS